MVTAVLRKLSVDSVMRKFKDKESIGVARFIKDDQRECEAFLSILKNEQDIEKRLLALSTKYDSEIAKMIKKNSLLSKMQKEEADLQKQLEKIANRKEHFIDRVKGLLKKGLKSLYFALESFSKRRSTSYKGACIDLVEQGFVPNEVMEKIIDDNSSRKVHEIFKFLGEEV